MTGHPPPPKPTLHTPPRPPGFYFSGRRVGAMVLRYFYLIRGSVPRIVELAYWPTMQMLIWGFLSQFLYQQSEWFLRAGGVLIAAVLLWDIMFRSNIGVAISFLEEMWSRNLGQLFASPLRPYEWATALLIIAGIRTLIGVVPAALLAIPLYHYSVFDMGLPLIAFFVNVLIFGAAVGLAVSGLVLLFGLGAESLAWAAIFAVAPLSGIYYPISVLPEWLQPIAYALPSSHVFEGMRAAVIDNVFLLDRFVWSVGLNVIYLALGLGAFLAAFRTARRRGKLLMMGE